MDSLRVCLVFFGIGCGVGEAKNIELRSWSYIDDDGDNVEVVPATLFHKSSLYKRSNEHHITKRCACYCRRKWERDYTCCECVDTTCFPGSARVTMATGDVTTVGNLAAGDRILTADSDGTIVATEVIGYIQRQRDVISGYWQITTANGRRLRLSKSHVMFVSAISGNGNYEHFKPRYAHDVKPGEYVLVREGSTVISTNVSAVDIVGGKGAYVPLTSSGTLLVDDVVVSCYASFPHDLAHMVMLPLRWSPWLLDWTPDNDTHLYVKIMKSLGRTVLPGSWFFTSSASDDVPSDDIKHHNFHDVSAAHTEL